MEKEKFLKEYLVERKGTNSLKWDALDVRFGSPNLLSMWVADMEIKTPKEIIEALKERIEHGVFGYSYVSDDYYNAVIKWHKEKHNVLVISDEIHQDIVMKGYKHIPSAIVENGKYTDNLITISAASKTFNLAGLIHSNIIISNDELRKKYDEEIKKINQTESNILGMLATQVGYEKGEYWLENIKELIEDNFNYLKSELNKNIPEIIVTNLEGTYLVFLDLRKIIPIDKVKEFIQDKCNLAIDFGEWFGANFKGFIRINLATDPQIVKKAVENIISEYKKLN